MKRSKLILVIAVCFVMILSACAQMPVTSTPAAPSASANTATTAAVTSAVPVVSPSAAATADATAAQLYALLPKNELVGLYDPNVPDRASINKAWPKTPKDAKKIKIGWTEIDMLNPWFVDVKNTAIKKAAEYGFDLDFEISGSDIAKQSQQIDAFIQEGVDIIVVDPDDVQACVADIQRAVAAGIPCMCIGTVPDSAAPILTTITDNPYMVGYNAGQYAGSQFAADEQINMACIPGKLGNSTAESRTCGMVGGMIAARLKAMNKFVSDADAQLRSYNMWEEMKTTGKASLDDLKIAILAYGEGGWSEEGGLSAAEPIIAANGDKLNFMTADNEFQCEGIIKAVNAAGLQDKIKVGTMSDGTKEGLQMVASGQLLSSGSWGGGQIGGGAIDFIKMIFQDGKDPSDLPMGSFFDPITFTKDNALSYIDPDTTNPFFKYGAFVFPKSIPELKAQ